MNRIKRNLYHAFGAALLLGAASCSDDIKIDTPSTGGGIADGKAPSIGFTMNLGSLGDATGSRSMIYGNDPSAFESYIDKNKVRVMMFANDGTFLYEPTDLNPIPLESNANGDNQWYVEIMNLQNLKTTAGGNGEISILDYIKQNPFKIAVLANWPTEAEAVEDITITQTNDDGTEVEISVPGAQRYAQYTFEQGQHLMQLSHFFLDNNYFDGDDDAFEHIVFRSNYDYSSTPGWEIPDGVYQPGQNYMGVSTKWIEQQFKNRNEANTYIRANYNVPTESSVDGMTPASGAGSRKYRNVWQVWNFGGSDNTFESFAGDRSADWGKYNDETVVAALDLNVQPNDSVTFDNLTIRPRSGSVNYKRTEGYDGNIGFMMPRNGVTAQPSNSTSVPDGGYMRLFAWADAKIRVKAGAVYAQGGGADNHDMWLCYRVEGKTYSELIKPKANIANTDGDDFSEIYEFEIGNATYDDGIKYVNTKTTPLEVYLFTACENDKDFMIIYEIEYITDDYLYKADRWGIAPSREHPIPMYGIQDFMPIGDYAKDNEIFNLSVYNGVSTPGYEYRDISMLRSLARVDVMLPKSIFPEPESVYMRSLNHSARCAPIDIYTPTDIIWYGAMGNYDPSKWAQVFGSYNNVVGASQELENIRAYGPNYMQGNTKDKNPNYLKDFQVRTSWFFGVWGDWGWNWNGLLKSSEIPTVKPFPRVFNTALSRADFANFIPVDDSEYWHYVLYTPEKNITDANNAGQLGERPKLIHVEIRFDGRNVTNNYDDNSAYRIYFTQGGLSMGRNELDNLEDENTVTFDDLTRFFPVVRNHNYRFTVTGVNQGNLQFEIKSAGNRDVNIGFN